MAASIGGKVSIMSASAHQVAFIDPNVADVDGLLLALRPEVEGMLLTGLEPAPRQMARMLAERRNLQTIHVIAHGAPGVVSFTAGPLSAINLCESAADLAEIGRALTRDGELLLWSCQTAAGELGRGLL